jgi:subtilisin family serine protease
MKKLRGRPEIESIEEDVVLYAIGQTKAWGVDRIDADLAWPTGNTGKGIKVAILDTGIDYDHPDLKLAGGVNYAGTSQDGYTSPSYWNDNYGHGTHVAGIVAARNNTIGVIGVAPDVSLWAVRVLGDNGSGYTSDIIQGLDWCVAHGIQMVTVWSMPRELQPFASPQPLLWKKPHQPGRRRRPCARSCIAPRRAARANSIC